MGPFEILCVALAIYFLYYYYTSTKFDFWKNRGVQGPKPTFFFGNFKDLILRRTSFADFFKNLYDEFPDEPMVGFFIRNEPALLVTDIDLLRDVMIKDFTNFTDRGIRVSEKVEPFSQNLLNLEHARWRPLRIKLSPTFTSGRLKEMFHLLLESGRFLEKYMETISSKNEPVEVRDITAKFTTNVIGSCAFGLDIDVFTDGDNEFLRRGKELFELNTWRKIKATIRDTLPWLYDLLAPIMRDKELNDFYLNLFMDTIKYRKTNNIVRHDFVDLLREIKENPEKVGDFEMTDELIVAQAFIFFIAGFETSSTTMSHALYELALNPQIQDKLREEICLELKKSDGVITYENLKDMKYLHKVFQETLRKYPPVTTLVRKSAGEYTFSNTNVTIPKNITIFIPAYGIQRDPNHYPNPDIFDPERFDEEAEKLRNPLLFLAFGAGPRNCVGSRFGIIQTKIGLINMLKNFKVEVCEKTLIPYVANPNSFLLRPKGGLHLKFSKI